jgi:hypothetical protein
MWQAEPVDDALDLGLLLRSLAGGDSSSSKACLEYEGGREDTAPVEFKLVVSANGCSSPSAERYVGGRMFPGILATSSRVDGLVGFFGGVLLSYIRTTFLDDSIKYYKVEMSKKKNRSSDCGGHVDVEQGLAILYHKQGMARLD